MEFTTWDSDPTATEGGERELGLFDPCPCGCDERGGPIRGYLSAGQAPFGGFSITARTEEDWRLLQRIAYVLGARRVLRTDRAAYGLPD